MCHTSRKRASRIPRRHKACRFAPLSTTSGSPRRFIASPRLDPRFRGDDKCWSTKAVSIARIRSRSAPPFQQWQASQRLGGRLRAHEAGQAPRRFISGSAPLRPSRALAIENCIPAGDVYRSHSRECVPARRGAKMTDEVADSFPISRRGVLLGTAALATAATSLPVGLGDIPGFPICTASVATAAPLPRAGSVAGPAKYRRWSISDPDFPPRVLDSYKKAIRAMLALPPTDPRNWYRHMLIHALDCPHANWWFLPWHRGYLGWFERICRDLSGDPQFALPYWDWTKEPRVPKADVRGCPQPERQRLHQGGRRVQGEIHGPCRQGRLLGPRQKSRRQPRAVAAVCSIAAAICSVSPGFCGSTCSTLRRGRSGSTSQTHAA